MSAPQLASRRSPSTVMRLRRLGSLHQSRLSFMRVLTRRMAKEQWQFTTPAFNVDKHGVGHAVYAAHTPHRTYSLIAFAHDLAPELRSDRVIAEAWDATFCLFDGVPTTADIQRLKSNVPLQEAGRVSENELTLSRANRSVRLWDQVVSALAAGQQPANTLLDKIGYLMRTTAVYGSGKFGAADRQCIAHRPELRGPFQVEMLTVYLIRAFVRDLVEHMARTIGQEKAVPLDDRLARGLGIGNSTGLGMAPFLVNHPVLLNNWVMAREEAIARVRRQKFATLEECSEFIELFQHSGESLSRWHSEHPLQQQKLRDLHEDYQKLQNYLNRFAMQHAYPWNRLFKWCETELSTEGQEWVLSLMLEPYGYLIDELVDTMDDRISDAFSIDGAMCVAEVRELIQRSFDWALTLPWGAPTNNARVWYTSEEKLEPRLGERYEEAIEDYEQPLAPARDASNAWGAMRLWNGSSPIASFLLEHPEHRSAVWRAQLAAQAPYAELRDNTISATMMPIDLLRAKLSFFGAERFDPRSDRWVRICMFAGAPYPKELDNQCADRWIYH
ncbi:MAG: hypothetical protein KTR32_39955 [Granulosicoccus sp.]|nr:hypothetical protein [Granulosicoccus sp.]